MNYSNQPDWPSQPPPTPTEEKVRTWVDDVVLTLVLTGFGLWIASYVYRFIYLPFIA